jgi:hypothetical protein
MPTLIFALGIVGTGLFIGFAGIFAAHMGFRLWMARLGIICWALAIGLYWQQTHWQHLTPDDRKAFDPRIWTIMAGSTLIFLIISFLLPTLLPTPNQPHPPTLTAPRFREAVDVVQFTLGGGYTARSTITALQKQAIEPFEFSNFRPIRFYADGNDIYVDFTVWAGTGEPSIEIKRNTFIVRPHGWDRNSSHTALEVVNEKQLPVFQLVYRTPSHIDIRGIFSMPNRLLVADDTGIRIISPQSSPSAISFSPRRLFKYPSWKYPGQLE